MFVSLRRVFHFGWMNFKRQGGLSIATTFIFVITVSLVSGLFLSYQVSQMVIDNLKEKIDISVYFHEVAQEEDILEVKSSIEELSGLREVLYISREDALAQFRERHGDNPVLLEALEELGSNPFFASLAIKAETPKDYATVARFIDTEVNPVLIANVDFHQREVIIERFFELSNTVQRFGIILALLLFTIALLIAFTHTKLAIYTSKEEIGIQRLVGASNWFIRGPFIAQGIFAGVLSVFISTLILFILFGLASSRLEGVLSGINIFSFYASNILTFLGLQLAVGVGLGVISSLIAMRKYLTI